MQPLVKPLMEIVYSRRNSQQKILSIFSSSLENCVSQKLFCIEPFFSVLVTVSTKWLTQKCRSKLKERKWKENESAEDYFDQVGMVHLGRCSGAQVLRLQKSRSKLKERKSNENESAEDCLEAGA